MIITYKEQGKTLGQLTNEIREKLKKKICYIGRLDPIASGMICFLEDDECKSQSSFIKFDKTYTFNLILGISTDSGDALGMITGISSCFEVEDKFMDLFNNFHYNQKYPLYSSYVIKKDGLKKPLWYFAKNGIKLEDNEIPVHSVHIKMLEKTDEEFYIKSTDYFIKQIEKLDDIKGECFRKEEVIKQYEQMESIHLLAIPLIAKVSSGTYIRRLCEDIGNYLKMPAMADSIERVAFHFPETVKNYEII